MTPPYLPWYLDTCNAREIIVKDSRGNVVHYDDLAFPSEWSGSRIREVVQELRANAMAVVEWSEKAILPIPRKGSHATGASSENLAASSAELEEIAQLSATKILNMTFWAGQNVHLLPKFTETLLEFYSKASSLKPKTTPESF